MAQRGRRNADHLFLTAMACGATVENAATSAGISQATAYRRLKDPEFQKQLRETKADMVTRTAGMLTAAAGEAVKTLMALQKDSIPPATRLGAAPALLEMGPRHRESAELEERIAVLETQRTESNQPPTFPTTP